MDKENRDNVPANNSAAVSMMRRVKFYLMKNQYQRNSLALDIVSHCIDSIQHEVALEQIKELVKVGWYNKTDDQC